MHDRLDLTPILSILIVHINNSTLAYSDLGRIILRNEHSVWHLLILTEIKDYQIIWFCSYKHLIRRIIVPFYKIRDVG